MITKKRVASISPRAKGRQILQKIGSPETLTESAKPTVPYLRWESVESSWSGKIRVIIAKGCI